MITTTKKGDHRHYGAREMPYRFSTVEQLLADFWTDVESIRRKGRTLSLFTPKRWELLKYVHGHPVRSVRALSMQLKRDYRRVCDDVEALAAAGLLERSGRMVRADYDAIETSFRFDHLRQ